MLKPPKVSPSEEASGGPSVPSGVLKHSDPSQEVQAKGSPSRPPCVPQKVQDATNWWCSVVALLCICAILLFLVVLMSLEVGSLEKKIIEEADLWQWKILTLTEILRDLQIGKVPSCSICKVQWMQQGDNCFLFRDKKMGWRSSEGFCHEENAHLAVASNAVEMKFLKFYSNKHYHQDPQTYEYDKFWIGLAYDTVKGRWLWTDGTPFNSGLHGKLDHKGCAYLQNETLYSQNCNEPAKIICARKVQFGWS